MCTRVKYEPMSGDKSSPVEKKSFFFCEGAQNPEKQQITMNYVHVYTSGEEEGEYSISL